MLTSLLRFVDRDMFMRYLGGGTYHTIMHKFLSIKKSFQKILEGAGLYREDFDGGDDDSDDEAGNMVVDGADGTMGQDGDDSGDSDDSSPDSDVEDDRFGAL